VNTDGDMVSRFERRVCVMKSAMKLVCFVIAVLVFSATIAASASQALSGAPLPSAGEAKNEFSAAQLKLMSTFLSNFTEVGLMDFDAKDVTNERDPADMIRFGIWHNYINNYRSRIRNCNVRGCPHGSLTIEGKFVTESIKKYFDVNYTKLVGVMDSDPPYHYDGKLYHFEGADGEAVYYARVDKVEKDSSGRFIMKGELYNADDKSDILGSFEALAKSYKYGGRDTWSIINMRTNFY
jgi:hypothetical protein